MTNLTDLLERYVDLVRLIANTPELVITFSVVAFILVLSNPRFRHLFLRRFFYSEARTDSSRALVDGVHNLSERLTRLERDLANRSEGVVIEDAAKDFISQRLPVLLDEQLQNKRIVDAALLRQLDDLVGQHVIASLNDKSPDELVTAKFRQHLFDYRQRQATEFDRLLEEQMDNAGRMKTAMINLFIFFNFAIIVFFLSGLSRVFAGESLYGVLGLYISLATFIFYIYRSSNNRTAMLIAIREDAKKYWDVMEYLERFRIDAALGEHDVEVIKTLFVNRAEREKVAQHPYEIILRGITESNILFKGGKVSFEKRAVPGKQDQAG